MAKKLWNLIIVLLTLIALVAVCVIACAIGVECGSVDP
jgi:hypothetical protein